MEKLTNSIENTAKNIIKNEEIRGTFIEMGSGPVIVQAIARLPGSSNTIEAGFYPNSKKIQQEMGVPENVRSVSFKAMKALIDRQDPDQNTILSSSWQIPSSSPVETHGWIGIKQKELEYYYHLRLTDEVQNSREKAQELIAEVGLKLLETGGIPAKIKDFLYIDQIVNAEGKSQIDVALNQYNLLDENKEHFLYINSRGNLERPTNLIREANKKGALIVFKGSFNPPTKAHLTIAEEAEKENGQKPVFMISVNTRYKGKVDTRNLQQRIEYINQLGYEVLICNKGGFVENTEYLRSLGLEIPLTHICGADTANRFEADDMTNLIKNNAKVQCISRPNLAENPTDSRIEILKMSAPVISSTDIRTKKEGFEDLLPEEIREMYLVNSREI